MIYKTYKWHLGNDFNLTVNAISLQIYISHGYLGKGLLAIESSTWNKASSVGKNDSEGYET